MSRYRTVGLAALVGLCAGLLVYRHYIMNAEWSDFDQIWIGARALVAGQDPYVEVSRGFPWPLLYPLPAIVLGVPFAVLPLTAARVVFAIATTAVLTWGLLRYRPYTWPLLATGPLAYAIIRGQWSPLLTAAAIVPVLGGLLIAKPSIGLPLVAAVRTPRKMLIGAGVLLLLSLLLQPSWPLSWLTALRGSNEHIQPLVFLPWGWVLLVAARCWREPEARLVLLLSIIPHNYTLYELVPLALVPRTLQQSLMLAISFNVLYALTLGRFPAAPMVAGQTPESMLLGWPYLLWLGYVPAVIVLLWERIRTLRAASGSR